MTTEAEAAIFDHGSMEVDLPAVNINSGPRIFSAEETRILSSVAQPFSVFRNSPLHPDISVSSSSTTLDHIRNLDMVLNREILRNS